MTYNTVAVTVGVDSSPADTSPAEGNVVAIPSGTEWPDSSGNPIVPMVVHGQFGGVGGTPGSVTISLIASDSFATGVLNWNFIINVRGMETINVPDVPVNYADGPAQSVWAILSNAGWTPTSVN